jgi:hypothetical protein
MSKHCSLAGVNTSATCESRCYRRDDNGEVQAAVEHRVYVCLLVFGRDQACSSTQAIQPLLDASALSSKARAARSYPAQTECMRQI